MRGTQMRSNSPDGRRKRGSTLVLFTLMLPTLLIPLMGLGIDATMLYIVQAKLSAATDGAALGAGRLLGTLANPAEIAGEFLAANFPSNQAVGFWGAAQLTPTITYTPGITKTITVNATASVPLLFSRIFGASSSVVSSVSVATRSDSRVVFVLDRSGSMNTSDGAGSTVIADAKTYASGFVQKFTEGTDEVGLVGFHGSAVVGYPTGAWTSTISMASTGGPNKTFNDGTANDLPHQIAAVTANSGTGMAEALSIAYIELQKAHMRDLADPVNHGVDTRLNSIVLLTDGVPTAVSLYLNNPAGSNANNIVDSSACTYKTISPPVPSSANMMQSWLAVTSSTGNPPFSGSSFYGMALLARTQVISVPTAAERSGQDTTAYAGDTLLVPVDPRIAKLIARYPLPNDPHGSYGARTFATSSKVQTVSDQFSARIDHNVSEKVKLFFRINVDNINGPTTNPSQTAIDPSFGVEYHDHQRNVALSMTRTPSAHFVSETSVSFTRTTPLFPARNETDPALKFGDGLYEPFNNAAGSVMGSYGNLFQVRQNFTWTRGKHTVKAGGEWRGNRDTTGFGISPNGEYQFGGGTAYSPVEIRSVSGLHDVHIGDPLPDSLTGLLTASAFTYTTAVAPAMFPQGDRIGDAGIHRDAYNFYVQDSWKIGDRLLLNYGLRYEMTTRIRERSMQTSGLEFTQVNGKPAVNLLVNPDPGYRWDPFGLGPRLAVEWRPSANTVVRAGGAITTLLINIWQDNALTGSTPFVFYPRLTAAPGQPIRFGTTITPQQLPTVYTINGSPMFASGNSKQVPGNTIMDVQRFESELAALSPDHRITPLNGAGITSNFQNGYMGTWTAGIEQKLRAVTVNASYVGTAGVKLAAVDSPNGYTGATPAFAPYTQFDSSGAITGGFGPIFLITNHAHSSYHALQVSASNNLTAWGLGVQASYSWSKSIDDLSSVLGAPPPQDPFDTRAERGPSSFDVTQAMSFSLFQDLHADRAPVLGRLGKTAMGGWQVLAIGTVNTGLPFTVVSGIQQTGVGAGGADRR